ncbi:hypothetical protein M2138_000438 [Dysgonomonadaceae bacterium PH5-43]|nr:hypothetical protein [Dysgonomonadaceae bacterium PH5-43]
MKKTKTNWLIIAFLFVSVTVASQQVKNPYNFQFRNSNGENKVNSGKSYFYVDTSMRGDGVLPSSYDDATYSNFEWYLMPVEDDPGWYYVLNGGGKYLIHKGKGTLSLGECTYDDKAKWRLYKANIYSTLEVENIFYLINRNETNIYILQRNSNTTILAINNLGGNSLYIQPSKDYLLFNNNLDLVSNYKANSNSGKPILTPDYLVSTESEEINSVYFPTNYKKLNTTNASLMYNRDSDSPYYLRFTKDDAVKTVFYHKKAEISKYKVTVKIRSSLLGESPAYMKFIDSESSDKYIKKKLYVDVVDEWTKMEFYIELEDFNDKPSIEIHSTQTEEETYFDFDGFDIEKVNDIPREYQLFELGEYDEEGNLLVDYPNDNPAFVYTVRVPEQTLSSGLFIPCYFHKETLDLNVEVSVSAVNGEGVDAILLSDVNLTDKGIEVSDTEILTSGNEYSLIIVVDCEEEQKIRKVNVKVVPDVVYWNPSNGISLYSWNNDDNWKDKNGGKAFVPLKVTDVVLTENQMSYPILDALGVEQGKSPLVEYDYNYVPNSCSSIKFENGAELANSFYLNYNNVEIEKKVETMKWYNISPPLKNMYSGDFLFDKLNPLTELQKYNIESSHIGYYNLGWSKSFSNTVVELNPAQGFNLRVGRLFYTNITDVGADESSKTFKDEVVYRFPNDNTSFELYDDMTKTPLGKTEYIPDNGKMFSHRFVYETIVDGECLVPEGEDLIEISVPEDSEEMLFVVGNPFMSGLDFNAFYLRNKEIIYPRFKIMNNSNEYITVLGIDEDNDGVIEGFTSTDLSFGLQSIKQMQSFIVTIKDSHSNQPLVIDKSMSKLSDQYLDKNENDMFNLLSIKLENENNTLSEALLAMDNELETTSLRSSKIMFNNYSVKNSYVFTVSKDVFFDVNYNEEIAEPIEIGVISDKGASNVLTIDNLDILKDKNKYSFYDAENDVKIPFVENDKIEYSFFNTEGELRNRFYIIRDLTNLQSQNSGEVLLFVEQGKIRLKSINLGAINKIELFSVDGRCLSSVNNINENEVELEHNLEQNTICVLLVTTENAIKTYKTIIK